MRHVLWAPVTLVLFSAIQSLAQAPQPAQTSEALALLERVAQHYADAKTYYIKSTEERTSTNDYSRDWQKSVFVAAEAPRDRIYFEGHSNVGSAMQISDGTTEWTYHVTEGRYTAKPVTLAATRSGPFAIADLPIMNAKNLRGLLKNLAKPLKSAEFLPDQDLTIDGQTILCKVVLIRSEDLKRADPNYTSVKTIWIDPRRNVVLKTFEKAHIERPNGATHLPLDLEANVVYSNVSLDEQVPDDLFTFTPPASARLIADFPDPRDMQMNSMAGDPVPPIKLKAADGTTTPIESYRGKPVLLDFWATWCAPCVASLPSLAQIYKEGKDDGLVLLSVDQDEDSAKAADFLKAKGYAWPDFHDGDGAIQKLMGSTPIPRILLVDAQGVIVYDSTGENETKLREHLAKLGPAFQNLAPRPAATGPCVATQMMTR